ncbi:hypothetical protein [Vibrio sp. YT-19(2023)]|uniref:hypothetical protein n=1 Tax=Vibrio sp. YT-19(2023) TaxID=3074710 RepID=UPI0029646BC2|nr:hypothetical protein [Vibrio sp. YT-19(2023)]MDW1501426.1 hypothetical protein [Vibrio sp. YT-19(2023)]
MDDFERDFEEFLVADTDPEPYLFEPEHTDEELHVFDAERARREAECTEWDLVLLLPSLGRYIIRRKSAAERASQGVKLHLLFLADDSSGSFSPVAW